jgi:hypothetical protein
MALECGMDPERDSIANEELRRKQIEPATRKTRRWVAINRGLSERQQAALERRAELMRQANRKNVLCRAAAIRTWEARRAG